MVQVHVARQSSISMEQQHQHQYSFRFCFHSARFGLLNIYCVCAEFPLQFVLGFLLYFGFFMATPPPPITPARSRLLILNPKPFTHQQLGTLLSPLHLMCPMCVSSPSAPPCVSELPSSPLTQKTKGRQITGIGGEWVHIVSLIVKLSPSLELSYAR